MTAREVALRTLTACESQDAWADAFLKRTLHQGSVTGRDAALATRITFGVLQNQLLLDWYLAQFSKRPLDKLERPVKNALRIGAYQLLFLDKVPARAAVDESVKLTRAFCRNPAAAGMVNAILRSLQRGLDSLTPPESLSLRTSHPQWLVDAFTARLGEEGARALLEYHNVQVPTAAQVNLCRGTTGQVSAALEEEGVTVTPHPWLEGCLLLSGTGDLERLESFQKGLFYVQDPAARLAVLAAAPAPGSRVLDACAAPGGKSFAAAVVMEGRGEILSCDIHPHKIALIEKGAARLGLACISAQVCNARQPQEGWAERFDTVIADVPCSGLGIIRKKPDIRYKDPTPLENLPAVQGAILDNVSTYVKPGGTLLYATCTLLERENEAVVAAFLGAHPEFALQPFVLPGPIGEVGEGMLTLWPHLHGTDGFFMAKLRKHL